MTRKFYLFTVMTALFLLAPATLWAAQSGKCGDNVTWTLDNDGVLTIAGTGAMTDYNSMSDVPWYRRPYTKVVIKDGVTTIGNYAFCSCTNLTSVTIPSTVTSIGGGAFSNCSGLVSVTIPNSVTTIGADAFSGCKGLTSVTLSNSLTSIAASLFYECEKLANVEIPNSVKSIGIAAFAYCSGLTSVSIPESMTTIETNTFAHCSGLTSVTFPKTLTTIGKSAFYECEKLTSIIIPASVEGIGEEAFMDCKGLTKIETLAKNPPLCGNNAFSGVDKFNCVLCVPATSVDAYVVADEWKDFNDVEALQAKVVASGNCGDNITWTLDADSLLTLKGTGAMYDYEYSPWDGMDVKKVVIGDGITTIGDYAFMGCTGLTSVEIPNSVTSIGKAAIGNCTGLTSITIPSSVTKIGWAALMGCTGLEKIESLAETPPACDNIAFYDVDMNKCVLSVPEASIEAYKAADQWKEFYNGITGVDGVAEESNVAVSASNGVITVTGAAANTVVEVYSISGTLVYSGTASIVAVPSAGIYVVKAADKTFKVNAAK